MNKIINKVPIVGFVRYSQRIKFGSSNKERDVFEKEYFEYRYNIFKNVTLKSFQQQTDTNFVLLLIHSENMPTPYKERFVELEKENLFLYNLFVKDNQDSFNDAILNSKDYISYLNDTAITFRIDNDDAVQSNFIEKLSSFLKKDFIGSSLSIPIIYIIKRISEQSYMMQERYYSANAIGLAYVTSKENYRTVFNLGDHDLVNTKNSLILLAKSGNGGLQTINGENELNSIDKSRAIVLNQEQLDDYLFQRKIEDLDLTCLKVYKDSNSRYSFKNILGLIKPPIYDIALNKIKAQFFKNKKEK